VLSVDDESYRKTIPYPKKGRSSGIGMKKSRISDPNTRKRKKKGKDHIRGGSESLLSTRKFIGRRRKGWMEQKETNGKNKKSGRQSA